MVSEIVHRTGKVTVCPAGFDTHFESTDDCKTRVWFSKDGVPLNPAPWGVAVGRLSEGGSYVLCPTTKPGSDILGFDLSVDDDYEVTANRSKIATLRSHKSHTVYPAPTFEFD